MKAILTFTPSMPSPAASLSANWRKPQLKLAAPRGTYHILTTLGHATPGKLPISTLWWSLTRGTVLTAWLIVIPPYFPCHRAQHNSGRIKGWYKILENRIFCRNCDSRNLNLSPLCDLAHPLSPAIWEDEVKKTYEDVNNMPDYVTSMNGLIRNRYPSDVLKDQEIITSLTKVNQILANLF